MKKFNDKRLEAVVGGVFSADFLKEILDSKSQVQALARFTSVNGEEKGDELAGVLISDFGMDAKEAAAAVKLGAVGFKSISPSSSSSLGYLPIIPKTRTRRRR